MATEETVYDRAVRLLAARDHGRAELARKLRAKGCPPAEIDAALERLAGAGYLDDAALVEREVERLVADGRGPAVVRQKLRARGLPADAVAAAVERLAAAGRFDEGCRAALRRRFGAGCGRDRTAWLRAARFLAGRGFDEATVRAALKEPPDGE